MVQFLSEKNGVSSRQADLKKLHLKQFSKKKKCFETAFFFSIHVLLQIGDSVSPFKGSLFDFHGREFFLAKFTRRITQTETSAYVRIEHTSRLIRAGISSGVIGGLLRA